MKSKLITIPIALILSGLVSGYSLADTYSLVDTVIGEGFYSFFEWQTIPDPTKGRVNYVNQETSKSANLTFASSDSFVLRADHTTVLKPSGPGRDSVRIRTVKTYKQHLAVFDIRHMPQGCATWPAIWETKEDTWPNSGEIDILEGVNDETPNYATLHTGSKCSMPASLPQTGKSASLDCNIGATGDKGCPVMFPSEISYGPSFNNVGGGWYVVERALTYYKIWFWPRNAGDVPSDVKNGASTATPGNWGTPVAYFPNTNCDFGVFEDHNIIINLTLCGSWAGGLSYGNSKCPSTCVDFVNNNPSEFADAYFDFAAIHIYQ